MNRPCSHVAFTFLALLVVMAACRSGGSGLRDSGTPDIGTRSLTDTAAPPYGSAGTHSDSANDAGRINQGNASANDECATNSEIQLVGNEIHDRSGARIVARGPEMVIGSTGQAAELDAVALLGANAARLLLAIDSANGMTSAGFDTVIGRAVSHNMILWISLYSWDVTHDNPIGAGLGGGNFYSLVAPPATGTCSKTTPAPCFLAVWSRPWLKELMVKYKGHVIIDAVQEYIGASSAETEDGRVEWANAAMAHIRWFRGAGYTNPLQVMSNYQGRDLYAIVQKGEAIRAVDTILVNGHPQTMFGWQAYWASDWYKTWQGSLLLGQGKRITSADAIHQFVASRSFPIQLGFDAVDADAGGEYAAEIDQAAADRASWLWWSWDSNAQKIECQGKGEACTNAVTKSVNGFAGALKSTCGI